jgi:hypothetical protein
MSEVPRGAVEYEYRFAEYEYRFAEYEYRFAEYEDVRCQASCERPILFLDFTSWRHEVAVQFERHFPRWLGQPTARSIRASVPASVASMRAS